MSQVQTLLLATTNRHKVGELNRLLKGLPYKVVGIEEFEGLKDLEVEETGSTFQENARIKALAYGAASGVTTLAEDSGICVAALGGGPGVFSARFGEELGDAAPKDDAARTDYLLKKLEGETNRKAWYECAICLVRGSDVLAECSGQVHGQISTIQAGKGGFGYDPVFVPEGYKETFAQLPPEVKAANSHRARAVSALRQVLERLAA